MSLATRRPHAQSRTSLPLEVVPLEPGRPGSADEGCGPGAALGRALAQGL